MLSTAAVSPFTAPSRSSSSWFCRARYSSTPSSSVQPAGGQQQGRGMGFS